MVSGACCMKIYAMYIRTDVFSHEKVFIAAKDFTHAKEQVQNIRVSRGDGKLAFFCELSMKDQRLLQD